MTHAWIPQSSNKGPEEIQWLIILWQNDGQNSGSFSAGSPYWYWEEKTGGCSKTEAGDSIVQVTGRAYWHWKKICQRLGKGKVQKIIAKFKAWQHRKCSLIATQETMQKSLG